MVVFYSTEKEKNIFLTKRHKISVAYIRKKVIKAMLLAILLLGEVKSERITRTLYPA